MVRAQGAVYVHGVNVPDVSAQATLRVLRVTYFREAPVEGIYDGEGDELTHASFGDIIHQPQSA